MVTRSSRGISRRCQRASHIASSSSRPRVACIFGSRAECTSLGYAPPLIEFVFDTTRAVTHLVLSGTLERCPDLRLIVPHAGAATSTTVAMAQAILRGIDLECGCFGRAVADPVSWTKVAFDTGLAMLAGWVAWSGTQSSLPNAS